VLFQKAGNSKVQPGSAGYLEAASLVLMLEKPVQVDRSMGDVHPDGNPHVHLNPHNIEFVAAELANRLKAIDPENEQFYQSNLEDFSYRWRQAIIGWEIRGKALQGKKIITHHTSWSYFIDWLKLDRINTLETKPGIPVTTSHLESLLRQVRGTDVLAVIRTPYAQSDASRWLSEKSGIPAVILPYTVGGEDSVVDLFTLFDQCLSNLEGLSHVQR